MCVCVCVCVCVYIYIYKTFSFLLCYDKLDNFMLRLGELYLVMLYVFMFSYFSLCWIGLL